MHSPDNLNQLYGNPSHDIAQNIPGELEGEQFVIDAFGEKCSIGPNGITLKHLKARKHLLEQEGIFPLLLTPTENHAVLYFLGYDKMTEKLLVVVLPLIFLGTFITRNLVVKSLAQQQINASDPLSTVSIIINSLCIIMFFSLFLVRPSLIMILLVIAIIAISHNMVLKEETYLLATHGKEYERYKINNQQEKILCQLMLFL